MTNVPCPACQALNSRELSACAACGGSLFAARVEHSIGELSKVTNRFRSFTEPRHTFYSFNGCGTMLLDYQPRPDGKYDAVRWVTLFCLPIVPLSAYIIKPTDQTVDHTTIAARFSVVYQTRLSPLRVLRTYLLAVIALAPIVIGSLNSTKLNHTLGGPLAFLAMLLAIIWGIYIVFFQIKNDGKAYKRAGSGS